MTYRLRFPALKAGLLALAGLGGCAAGPDDVRPTLDVPAAYKEAAPWKPAEPKAADSRSPWWNAYADPTLGELLGDASAANQNLRVAEAQYRQAQALAAQARSALFPSVGLNAGVARERIAGNNGSGARVATADNLNLAASWEPDLWGGVRRSVEAGAASAEASEDDFAAAHLSIQTTLAQTYLQLRFIDLQRDLYADTTAAYARSLQLTQSQYRAGVALRSDVALAESQLNTAQAQAEDLESDRRQLEHAIAVLTGRAPAAFSLPAATRDAPFRPQLPPAPAAVPSELLERRPDVAAAERRAAAANANIGVARAAFFPSVVLSAGGGVSGVGLGSLFDAPGRVWSLGVALAQTVFDAGLRRAQSDQAVAAYDAAVAQYKQTVLSGFQQVEDNLAILRVLERETALQDDAVRAAQLAERLALAQYRGGTATYLSVVTAQQLSLSNQRTAVQLRGRQFAASVSLVGALGGGWKPLSTSPAVPS